MGKIIFDYWKNLNPKTIKFTRLHPARYYYRENYLDDGLLLKLFPCSVKNIELDCACNKINWLFNLIIFFPKRRFDTLEFGDKFLSGVGGVWNFGNKLIKLIERFKQVKITLKDELSHGIAGYFFRKMIFLWQINDTEIEFDVKLSLKKLADDQNRLSIPEREQTPEGFAAEIFKSLFLKMKCLSVTCERSWTKPSIRFRGLFTKLVGEMANLKTLEMSMKIFSGLKEFYSFINVLSIGIKNLKFVNCGRLNNYSMKLLSTNCPNIENLSIESVNWRNISIRKITSLFKNLKSLSILFLHDEKNISLFKKLVGASDENGFKVTAWPELDFLQIIFASPTAREKSEVEKIERNTPRKSGVFLVNHYPDTYGSNNNVLEVIFQKKAGYYSEFMDIFK
uniref:F-box domain-containing protein n=1 Tax=Strongyloides papillosus TaxID=174720 RepID=A0A0N5CEX1_STREA